MTIDTTTPAAPAVTTISTDTGAPGDGVTSDNTLVIGGTAEAGSTVTVYVDGNPVGTTLTDGAGNWSFDYSGTPLADGTYTIGATATDAAGNTSPASGGYTVTVDTTAPTGTVNPVVTTDPTPPVTGTVNDPTAAVTVTVNGNTYVATNNGDGTWTLADDTIAPLPPGTYPVTVTITDPAGNSTSVVGSLQVNSTPTAVADAYGTTRNQTLTVAAGAGVLANDTDPELDPLTAGIVATTTNGTLTLNADGSFTYVPNAGFAGVDTFTYAASDGVSSSTATVTITVANTSPTAANESYVVDEDNVLTVGAGAGLLANDADADGDPLAAVLVAGPSHGTLTLAADGSLVYRPGQDFFGTDTFTYRVSDGLASSNVATVTIAVNPVNDAPQLVNTTLTVTGGGTVTIGTSNLGATDVDNAWSTLVYTVSQMQNGYFQFASAPGVPVASFTQADIAAGLVQFVASGSGTPSFLVSVTDGSLVDGPRAATVLYTGGAIPGSGGGGGVDPLPPLGDLAFAGGPSDAATPLVDPAAVNFIRRPTVPPSADQPTDEQAKPVGRKPDQPRIVAQDDSYETKAGGQLSVAATAGVLANDRGFDLKSVSIRVTQMPANGALSLDTNGSFVYTPVPGFAGTDTFMYEVRTADGRTATGTVTLVVRGITDADKVREEEIGGPGREQNERAPEPAVEAELRLQLPAGRGDIPEDAGEEITVVLNAVKITGLALSVGAVWWAARAGGLIASLLASAPAWRHLDPLPVLGRAEDDEEVEWAEPEDADAKRDEQAVTTVLGDT